MFAFYFATPFYQDSTKVKLSQELGCLSQFCFSNYNFPNECQLSFQQLFDLSLPLTGITRFDLLGDFGRFNWLGNFYIVLSYNLLFAVVTTLCLVRKFTSAVREELLKALGKFIYLSIIHVCRGFITSSLLQHTNIPHCLSFHFLRVLQGLTNNTAFDMLDIL